MFGIYREGFCDYMWEDVYDTMEEAIEQAEALTVDEEDAVGLMIVEIIPRKIAVLPLVKLFGKKCKKFESPPHSGILVLYCSQKRTMAQSAGSNGLRDSVVCFF